MDACFQGKIAVVTGAGGNVAKATPSIPKFDPRELEADRPDDPPENLGGVERIMTSFANIDKAVNGIRKSENLGVTMCQATYYIMGEDLFKIIPLLAEKIFFIHFRNTRGNLTEYRETFHDNGSLNMAVIRGTMRSGDTSRSGI